MSVDHFLEMNTQLSVEEVIPILFRNFDYTQRPPDEEGVIQVNTDFFIADVRRLTEEDYASASPWGIESTIEVYIHNVRHIPLVDDGEIGSEAMVRMTVDWLKETQDDTALLFQGAIAMLIRKSGELIRNSDESVWTSRALVLVTLPHKVEYIPSH